jgi:hypothetical protein
MSRLGGTALTLAAVFATACGSGAASEAAAPSAGAPQPPAKPRLVVGALSPLTIRGFGFKARERVTLTLDGGRRGTKRVQADRRGSLTARFHVRVAPCGTLLVRAVGSRGSRVTYQLRRPDCREP